MQKHVLELDLSHVRHAYIFGDLHGRFDLLERKLKEVDFDPKLDALLATGDNIDRGAYSAKVLEYPIISALGNHEYWAVLSCFNSVIAQHHIKYGGQWFHDLDEDTRAYFAKEFQKYPVAIEVLFEGKKYGIVHADVAGNDWSIFKESLLGHPDSEFHKNCDAFHALNSRSRIKDWFTGYNHESHEPIKNIDQVYVGHTDFYTPLSLHNINYLDTKAYASNNLTFVRLGKTFAQAPEFHAVYSDDAYWL